MQVLNSKLNNEGPPFTCSTPHLANKDLIHALQINLVSSRLRSWIISVIVSAYYFTSPHKTEEYQGWTKTLKMMNFIRTSELDLILQTPLKHRPKETPVHFFPTELSLLHQDSREAIPQFYYQIRKWRFLGLENKCKSCSSYFLG